MQRSLLAVWLMVAREAAMGFAPLCRHAHVPTVHMAVSKRDSYAITLLPGDGIGPEITEATKDVLASVADRFGFQMDLTESLIGGAAIDEANDPFPQESLDQCRSGDSVLLACIGGYKVGLFESLLLTYAA